MVGPVGFCTDSRCETIAPSQIWSRLLRYGLRGRSSLIPIAEQVLQRTAYLVAFIVERVAIHDYCPANIRRIQRMGNTHKKCNHHTENKTTTTNHLNGHCTCTLDGIIVQSTASEVHRTCFGAAHLLLLLGYPPALGLHLFVFHNKCILDEPQQSNHGFGNKHPLLVVGTCEPKRRQPCRNRSLVG